MVASGGMVAVGIRVAVAVGTGIGVLVVGMAVLVEAVVLVVGETAVITSAP